MATKIFKTKLDKYLVKSYIKNITEIPGVSGFGIKDREQVKQVCEISDGAVVGSSIVKIIESNINNEDKMITLVANFVKQLKEGILE